jgi:hypothetical protein
VASSSYSGAITTSQNNLFISVAVATSILYWKLKPSKADVGSQANAASTLH